jgi:hypothetical protein
MQRLTLDAEAGRVSEELAVCGIAAKTRVPMAAVAQAGGAFAFLAEEPDFYTDADAIERNS